MSLPNHEVQHRVTGKQVALTAHAALLIGALFFIVPALTGWDSHGGYLLALTFYWLFFCLPVIGWHALEGNDGRLFSEKIAWRDWWILPLLVLQVGLVAIINFVPNTSILSQGGMYLALLIAFINGPVEEIAWRGGFLGTFRDRPRLGFWLGWALFVTWHVPLAMSVGIVFDGGAMALIGGAAALGLLWAWIAWRTGSVFYVSLAHGLTNVFVLWVLFDRNGFAA
ncbi:CPBP family intramembrane glutamic endopeptidase [Devosia sediminis]|uniref:CPBP family intramembrane metalloprotease n=1 Tax=Devosia sediminis TaxID=2798801 RepID=A0A934MLQ6_9HYPH|nr:CPBP family intramembrane glutamic endopeptidase [Devosia sediminis]MBJ3786498.1 CPBP family intramembrane metalloprotease [Devosia sediminis]